MNHATTGAFRKKIIIMGGIVIVLIAAFALTRPSADKTDEERTTQKYSTEQTETPKSFDATAHSTTDPASPWVVVNKRHALDPKTYTPPLTVPAVALKGGRSASNMHVSTQMSSALASMFDGAKAAGYNLMLSSGYRSYAYQVSVYGRIVGSKGQAKADTESARPGHSEHQTGLAADIAPRSGKCDLSQCFGSTPEGKWVAANAYKYGFIIRYTPDKVSVTGYEYEPWHVRYVGTDLSKEMHARGTETLEEFFKVSGGTSYNE